jgi:hypothetical protein
MLLSGHAPHAGFGDPEVMAAVDEIAKNPEAMKKYKGNRKVGGSWGTTRSHAPRLVCVWTLRAMMRLCDHMA